jgi:hypothetical protein
MMTTVVPGYDAALQHEQDEGAGHLWIQIRPWGYVGSMSALPESGYGWAIYEYTP